MNIIFAGVDPGMHGGVALINAGKVSVFDPPLKNVKVKGKKDKKDYDIGAMVDILKQFSGSKVVFIIEAVFSMAGQGVSSTFNFGRGKGIWEGMAYALGFEVHMVSPQTWKKDYDGLIQHRPKRSKDQQPQTAKEKTEAAKQKRLSKALAKEKARLIAGQLCPELIDRFKTVNSDGRAEAVLIAHYAQKHYTGVDNAIQQ